MGTCSFMEHRAKTGNLYIKNVLGRTATSKEKKRKKVDGALGGKEKGVFRGCR